MIINHNLSSINALNSITRTDAQMSKSLEKLSSGLRINRAADDAAGLAISEKMRAQVTGLGVAQRNAADGISLIQTAEGALNETHSILQRMRELSVQAANGTYSATDKTNLQTEMTGLLAEIDNIGANTKFNGVALLDGSQSAAGVSLQIGQGSGDTLAVKIKNAQSAALGVAVTGNINVLTLADVDVVNDAAESIKAIDQAIDDISTSRADLGAYQNRLEHTVNNLATTSENLQGAESRIRDTDMALEMSNFTKHQILMQSGISMAAQANQKSQAVMKLLG